MRQRSRAGCLFACATALGMAVWPAAGAERDDSREVLRPFVGDWASTGRACRGGEGTARITRITLSEVRTGESRCVVKSVQRENDHMNVVANCAHDPTVSVADERWVFVPRGEDAFQWWRAANASFKFNEVRCKPVEQAERRPTADAGTQVAAVVAALQTAHTPPLPRRKPRPPQIRATADADAVHLPLSQTPRQAPATTAAASSALAAQAVSPPPPIRRP